MNWYIRTEPELLCSNQRLLEEREMAVYPGGKNKWQHSLNNPATKYIYQTYFVLIEVVL